MVTMELREYQQSGVERALAHLSSGKSTVLVAPTGSGKTVMASEVVKSFRNVLFVAHRRELVEQARAAIKGSDTYINTVQSFRAFPEKNFDLLVIDEAHRSTAQTYQSIIKRYPSAVRLGLTATPWRTDGRGLSDAFDEIVEVATVSELVSAGHLVPYSAYQAPDEALEHLDRIKRRCGDYDQSELNDLMNQPRLVGDIAREYATHAMGRKAIAFAVGVKHSLAMAHALRSVGVRAAHLDGNTPIEERRKVLNSLSSGNIDVLCNVDLFTEGWDCPPVSCIIMARPTQSLTLYLQSVGRGMRPSPGKENLVILDHAGNCDRHGYPDSPRNWSLKSRAEIAAKDRREAEEARVRALGYGSLEEYALELKRVADTTYLADECRARIEPFGIKNVSSFLEQFNVHPFSVRGPATRYSRKEVDSVVMLMESSCTIAECSRLLSSGRQATRALLKSLGVNPVHGDGKGKTLRFDKQEIENIISLVRESYSPKEIGRILGIKAESVHEYMASRGVKMSIRLNRNALYMKADVEKLRSMANDYYSIDACREMLRGVLGMSLNGGECGRLLRRNGIYPAGGKNSPWRGMYPKRQVDELVLKASDSVTASEALIMSGLSRAAFYRTIKEQGIKPVIGSGGPNTRYAKKDVAVLRSFIAVAMCA